MFTKWPTVPPQGWRFYEQESCIEGETFEQLADNLASYRAANHLPAGNPSSDIERFVAARWPHVLGLKEAPDDPDVPKTIYGKPEQKRIAERVGSWTAVRFSRLGALKFVEPEVAQKRANICIQCKFNRASWKRDAAESCPGCKANIDAVEVLSFKIRKGKQVAREGKIGACLVAGHCNQTAVWLDDQGLQHARHYQLELPQHCWLKK